MIGRWKRRGNHLATARLSVRPRLSWRIRLLFSTLAFIALLLLVWAGFYFGQLRGLGDSRAHQASQLAKIEAGNKGRALSALEQQLQDTQQLLRLEISTREALSRQLAQAQTDQGGLREQIAFYESLLTETGRTSALSVEMLRVEQTVPGHYRVRAILVQGQSSARAFSGELELSLQFEREGKRELLVWPKPRQMVEVSRFFRWERDLQLPTGARLRNLQLRVYGQGENRPRLMKSYEVKG